MALQASSKVKGITIEIGADTSKFGYEMSQIRKEATLISKDMRSVDEAMKLDPTNVGKAADKLKLLREQADNATKKVNTIKAAIDALNKEYQDKSSKEYTEQLQHLERQLESATREQEVANARLREFESSAGEAGTAAVNLGDLIKGNIISNAIMTGLQKLWDLAKGLARELIEAGKELFKFSKDAVDVAAQYEDALGYAEKVFGGYSETVEQWVKDNSEFLRINISDLQVYANNLGTAFSALGLKREDSVKFSQEILKLSADIRAATGKDIEEIVSALTRGFTSSTRNLRQFGLFVSEADIKIQALKDGIVEFSGDQEELNRLMVEYTLAAADANKALEQYTEDSDQFREAEEKANQAADALNAILGDQEVTLTSSERATALYNLIMERLGFLMGQNAEESKLYNSQVELLKTKFANLKLEIGNELLPVFTDLVTAFNDFLGSEEGKAMLESIVDQFEKWGKTVKEWVASGEMAQFFSDMGEKIPQVVEDVGDFVDGIIDLIPKIETLVERLLELFGIQTEAEKSKEALYAHRKELDELAKSYDTDTDTIIKAIMAFAEQNDLTFSEVVNNMESYSGDITDYLNQVKESYRVDLNDVWEVITDFKQKHGLEMNDILSDWETYEPQIEQHAAQMGEDYSTNFNISIGHLQDFANQTGMTLGDVLTEFQNGNIAIIDEWQQFQGDTATMEDAVVQEVAQLGPDTQSAIDTGISNVNTSAWDNFWYGVKQTAMDVWDFIKTVTNPSSWDNTGFDLSMGGMPHANGGIVRAGQLYQINDDAGHRIESFIPNVDGYILNGNQTDRIINNNNNNNYRNFSGSVNIYVNSYGTNVAEVADELGAAFENRLRISGAML